MKVTLLTHTPNPELVVATAAHTCVSADDPAEFYRNLLCQPREFSTQFFRKPLEMGHTSILEHAAFTFAISGVSRSLTHQLVRFRVASYSQQSQRYLQFDEKGFDFITPDTIAANPALREYYDRLMAEINVFYQKAVAEDIPAEDARFPVPNAAATTIIMTMNARELHHAASLRECAHAQWEIRRLFQAINPLVSEVAPALFQNLGPACVQTGRCPEGNRCCGRINRKEPNPDSRCPSCTNYAACNQCQ